MPNLRELRQKKLWMIQQAASDDWEIESRDRSPELRKMLSQMDPQELAERGINFDPAVMQPEQWVLSSGYGKTAAIRVNPLKIQEDFQVEAEAGSYLAVDDDLRRAAANDLEQVALSALDVIDIRKVVRFHLGTIRGIGGPDSYIKPENPNPGPPPAEINISLSMPFDKLPEDVQNQILPMLGLQPSQELKHEATVNAVGKLSQAADHASNLLSAAEQPDAGQQKPGAAGHGA
ncbi:MAG TPA: hypothetical protein VIH91_11215 [Terriglobales bacterium]